MNKIFSSLAYLLASIYLVIIIAALGICVWMFFASLFIPGGTPFAWIILGIFVFCLLIE